MPNILLTNFCNRQCPYCFAKAQVELGTVQPRWELPSDEYDTILSYLNPTLDFVSLLGGEPTLHSRFADYVERARSAGFRIKIFTNGATRFLRSIDQFKDDENISIILNLNDKSSYVSAEWNEIEHNFKVFGSRISISFNVYQPVFSWDFLKDTILTYGLSRSIRLGIAQPIQVLNNEYLLDADMPKTLSRIVEMAEDMANSGINLGFDCGFRMCDFTQDQLGILAQCGTVPLFVCNPILDIGPDLQVWRCFPFSMEKGQTLTDYRSLNDLINYFNNDWKKTKQINNSRCDDCTNYLIASCKGGCLSRKIIR